MIELMSKKVNGLKIESMQRSSEAGPYIITVKAGTPADSRLQRYRVASWDGVSASWDWASDVLTRAEAMEATYKNCI